MSIDALIARMTQDAQARIAAVRAAADSEIAALLEAGTQAAARDLEQSLAARHAARQAAFQVERGLAQRAASTRLLSAQHVLLDRVFERAAALAAVAGNDARYLETLGQRIATVVGHLGGQPATLRCHSELAVHLRPLLEQLPQIELVVDDTLGAGFTASTRDASCSIDCTLPVRLGELRPRLEAGLLARVPA
jgi:vacuolar-type H+-ATPase subunit E/Vma4